MKKEYSKPTADFVSLAPAQQLSTNASYYDDDIGLGGGTGSNPFD